MATDVVIEIWLCSTFRTAPRGSPHGARSGANGKSSHCSTRTRYGDLNPPVSLFPKTCSPPILPPGNLNPRGMCCAVCLNPNNFYTQRLRNCRYSSFHLPYLYHLSTAEIGHWGYFYSPPFPFTSHPTVRGRLIRTITQESHPCCRSGCLNSAQSSKQIVPHRRIG